MPTFLVLLTLIVAADGAAAPLEPAAPTAPTAAPVAPAAVAPAADTRTRVLVTDTSGDLPPEKRALLTNIVATRLQRFTALRVIAQRDVQQRLGLEADKQLAGCESDAACLAELAGAFDVDIVCTSSAGVLGGTTVFTIQLVDDTGAAKARGTATVSALDDLAGAVAAVVDTAGREATGDEPADPVIAKATPTTPTTPLSSAWRFPLLLGGAVGVATGLTAAGIGVIPGLLYRGAEDDLTTLRVRYVESDKDPAILADATAKQAEADRLRGLWNNAGVPAFWIGSLVVVAGGAALTAGLLLTPETE